MRQNRTPEPAVAGKSRRRNARRLFSLSGKASFNPLRTPSCGGRPCLRSLRIRVRELLDLLAAGASREQILADFPLPEAGDITAFH
jgi:hypothetical protein